MIFEPLRSVLLPTEPFLTLEHLFASLQKIAHNLQILYFTNAVFTRVVVDSYLEVCLYLVSLAHIRASLLARPSLLINAAPVATNESNYMRHLPRPELKYAIEVYFLLIGIFPANLGTLSQFESLRRLLFL